MQFDLWFIFYVEHKCQQVSLGSGSGVPGIRAGTRFHRWWLCGSLLDRRQLIYEHQRWCLPLGWRGLQITRAYSILVPQTASTESQQEVSSQVHYFHAGSIAFIRISVCFIPFSGEPTVWVAPHGAIMVLMLILRSQMCSRWRVAREGLQLLDWWYTNAKEQCLVSRHVT